MVVAYAHCQAEFAAKNLRARFCSDRCPEQRGRPSGGMSWL